MLSQGPNPLAVRLINKTGGASVKGSLIAAGAAVAQSFVLQASEYDTIGVVLEAGVPDGSYCWCQLGGVCQMLLKNTVGSTAGQLVIAADTDGRCDVVAAPPPPPTADTHFKEVGHCLETVVGGTDKLVWVASHFN